MTALAYLDTLISASEFSSIPVQTVELKMLHSLLVKEEAERNARWAAQTVFPKKPT